jgi:DNA-binding NarL/FixJ family response regulator
MAIVLWLADATTVGLIESLRRRFDHTPVVVVCESVRRWKVRALLAAGVGGVVVREELDSSLGPCLRAVRAGQVCVPREHSGQVQPRPLSAREREIVGLAAVGYMNSQIAQRLFLAESTVKSHLSSAFGKLGVRSRNEAAELIASDRRSSVASMSSLVEGVHDGATGSSL